MNKRQNPYYRSGKNTLPSGREMVAGDFYMADDDHGSVTHIHADIPIELDPAIVPDLSMTAATVSIPTHPAVRVEGNAHPEATFVITPHVFKFDYQLIDKVHDLEPISPNDVNPHKIFTVSNLKQLGHMYNVPYDEDRILKVVHYPEYPIVYKHNGELLFETRFHGQFYTQVDGGVYVAQIVEGSSQMIVKLNDLAEADHLAGIGWAAKQQL